MPNRITDPTIGIAITQASLFQDFIVEDGRGLSGANSYVNLTDAGLLLADHPYAQQWGALTQAQQEQALKGAAFWIDDRFRFYGQSLTIVQALQWPRTTNYDRNGALIYPGTIPTQLKKAAAYVAAVWSHDTGLFNEVPAEGQVRSFSEEGLSISFDPKASVGFLLSGTRLPEVELLLKSIGEYKTAEYWDLKQTQVRQ